MASETSKLTIRLPSKDLAFARTYAKAHGISVTELIDRYLRQMQVAETYSPSPELDEITGLLPSDLDLEAVYEDHLVDKHCR